MHNCFCLGRLIIFKWLLLLGIACSWPSHFELDYCQVKSWLDAMASLGSNGKRQIKLHVVITTYSGKIMAGKNLWCLRVLFRIATIVNLSLFDCISKIKSCQENLKS